MSAVFKDAFTSAQWNTHVRDNLLETMPGKATTAGRWFVATGTNAIAERAISSAVVNTSETTTSTSYTDLTTSGPAVTVTTGTQALVFIASFTNNNTAGASTFAGVAVSGATSISAGDTWAFIYDGHAASNSVRGCVVRHFDNLTAGSNTFTMKYKVSSGTGTWNNREICVLAL